MRAQTLDATLDARYNGCCAKRDSRSRKCLSSTSVELSVTFLSLSILIRALHSRFTSSRLRLDSAYFTATSCHLFLNFCQLFVSFFRGVINSTLPRLLQSPFHLIRNLKVYFFCHVFLFQLYLPVRRMEERKTEAWAISGAAIVEKWSVNELLGEGEKLEVVDRLGKLNGGESRNGASRGVLDR